MTVVEMTMMVVEKVVERVVEMMTLFRYLGRDQRMTPPESPRESAHNISSQVLMAMLVFVMVVMIKLVFVMVGPSSYHGVFFVVVMLMVR